MNPSPGSQRFKDDGRRLEDFASEAWVRCPHCDSQAIIHASPHPTFLGSASGHRLVCSHCAAVRELPHSGLAMQDLEIIDGAMTAWGHTLWLQTATDGQILWALNPGHADQLRQYVGASLRERQWAPSSPRPGSPARTMMHRKLGGTSAMSRVPQWLNRRHSRDSILKAIDKLLAMTDTTQAQ